MFDAESDEENAKWEADEIIPGLYLGGLDSALDRCALAERAIGLMITIHDMDQPAPPDCLWHLITCSDRADANLLRHLHGCADLLAAQLGGHVDALLNRSSAAQSNASRAALVHCIAGQSRSCTIVAAFLVRERGLTLREAMRQIQHRRPSASPNRGFWRQLVAFERGCRRGEASYEEAELPGSVMFERDALDRIIAAHEGGRFRSCHDVVAFPPSPQASVGVALPPTGSRKRGREADLPEIPEAEIPDIPVSAGAGAVEGAAEAPATSGSSAAVRPRKLDKDGHYLPYAGLSIVWPLRGTCPKPPNVLQKHVPPAHTPSPPPPPWADLPATVERLLGPTFVPLPAHSYHVTMLDIITKARALGHGASSEDWHAYCRLRGPRLVTAKALLGLENFAGCGLGGETAFVPGLRLQNVQIHPGVVCAELELPRADTARAAAVEAALAHALALERPGRRWPLHLTLAYRRPGDSGEVGEEARAELAAAVEACVGSEPLPLEAPCVSAFEDLTLFVPWSADVMAPPLTMEEARSPPRCRSES